MTSGPLARVSIAARSPPGRRFTSVPHLNASFRSVWNILAWKFLASIWFAFSAPRMDFSRNYSIYRRLSMRRNSIELGTLSTSILVFTLSAFPLFSADRQLFSGNVPSEVARLNLRPLSCVAGTNQLRLALCLPLRDSEGLSNLLAAIYDPDRKSTRLNSSHRCISYAVFCL